MKRALLRLALLAVVVVGVAAAVAVIRQRMVVVDATARGIEAELAGLDPLTGAAVIARLAADTRSAATRDR